MVEITSTSPDMTIIAEAADTYAVKYELCKVLDIRNATGDDIYINTTGDFTSSSGVGKYSSIPAGGAYNGYRPDFAGAGTVYIYVQSAGEISITEKRW